MSSSRFIRRLKYLSEMKTNSEGVQNKDYSIKCSLRKKVETVVSITGRFGNENHTK